MPQSRFLHYALALLLLLLSASLAAPLIIPTALPTPAWAHEPLNLTNRFRDSMGTALRLERFGPLRKFDIVRTLRSGPVAGVLRDTLFNKERIPVCIANETHGCDMAYNGCGTVGEVQYVFEDDKNNRRGRSSQVMLSCRCLGTECKEAVLMQPYRIYEDGNSSNTVFKSCVYERVKERVKETQQLSECHTELLRLSARKKLRTLADLRRNTTGSARKKPRTLADFDLDLQFFNNDSTTPWVYDVRGDDDYDVREDADWVAYGQRGWIRQMSMSDFLALPSVNLSQLTVDMAVQKENDGPASVNNRFYFAYSNPDSILETELIRDEDLEEGKICAELYEYAKDGAAWAGTQQDDIAIARTPSTYSQRLPPLISPTELALSCSAAALGTYTVWSMYLKSRVVKQATYWNLAFIVGAQIVVYVLEALPLGLALLSEIGATASQTQFAHIDGTVAVAKDMQSNLAKTAVGSIYVGTGIIGQVRYQRTGVRWVALFFTFFSLVTVAGIIATIVARIRFMSDIRYGLVGEPDMPEVLLGNMQHRKWVMNVLGLFPPEDKDSNF